MIQTEAIKRGYHSCAAVIAQAIIESAAGTSGLAKYHNYFGMKCGSSWKGESVNFKTKEEYKVGTLATIRDNFRVYESMEAGVKGYYDFISSARYSNLKQATDYKTYATFLKNDGYATSSAYVNTLCACVTKYNLTQFDKGYMPTLRRGDRSEAVRNLQSFLTYRGYTLVIDGIFGIRTFEAVQAFQSERNITVDGIVGPVTWSKLLEE
ncbi:MAG: glucosaminidase domain-containing protein [Bacteroidales bacterium]|nr:glucosaminidase domain-containing protein [Candidatus Scybalousia scybalohippi]